MHPKTIYPEWPVCPVHMPTAAVWRGSVNVGGCCRTDARHVEALWN